MLQRCYNAKTEHYDSYGGRGIAVCERWRRNFAAFYADMGPRPSPDHSIERRNNDGSYSPENCRWATVTEQASNKRSSRRLVFRGETLTLAAWSRRIGITPATLHERLAKWSLERALSEQSHRR